MQTITRPTPIGINILFALIISIGAIILLLHYSITQAYYSPILIKNCEQSFIGYEYQPRLEKPCRPLWINWTNQIKNNHELSA